VKSQTLERWRRYHRAIAITGIAVVATFTGLAGSGMGPVDGLVYDLSLAVTDRRPGVPDEPVAVIALDPISLDSEELAAMPRVFFSPVWAKLLNGLTAADARVFGFDIIFGYSANQFPGLGGQYDREFLVALADAREKVVLARSDRSFPAAPFVAAVLDPINDAGRDQPAAIAYAGLTPDADGVFRHLAARVGNHQPHLTFAAELLARAKGRPMPQDVLLAPRRPLEDIPTYRVIDVLRCLAKDPGSLRQAFSGKVVLIGTNLPDEDRERTPDRFMRSRAAQEVRVGGCRLDRLGASAPGSATTPGVFIHAAAVEAVLTGNLIQPVPVVVRVAASGITATVAALLGFMLTPLLASIAFILLTLVCVIAAPVSLSLGFWFPPVQSVAVALAAMIVSYLIRLLVEERRRRRVQHAFGHYLAPSIVDQLVDSERPLRLGGERREITVMFADLSGFTALADKVSAEELTALTNKYLAIVVAAVEANGGYVDKFIGDAVMGIWGAPGLSSDHPSAASSAALRAVSDVMSSKVLADLRNEPSFSIKVGLNSGPAIVGNVGAEKRYNYTALGQTVNIAARLENVAADYGCGIVIGPTTAAAIEKQFVLCELDRIKVKGVTDAITIFELVSEKANADENTLTYSKQYHKALECYRAGRFAEAERRWRNCVPHPYLADNSPCVVMANRAATLLSAPPVHWDGVYIKDTK
jgi:adenylate cyclase